MPLPAQGRSCIQVQEPHHLPGYGGYVPQIKYRCGETVSAVSHKLLLDPDVHKSGNLVLADYQNADRRAEDRRREQKKLQLKNRTTSVGDQKYIYPLVPGYTGTIPKSVNYFGKTQAQAALDSVCDFEAKQRIIKKNRDDLIRLNCVQSGRPIPPSLDIGIEPELLTAKDMPLTPIARDMAPYKPRLSHKPESSVYKMENDNKNKRFITGYMGFVPSTRGIFGKDFDNMTHTGLNMFTDDLKMRSSIAQTPVQVHRHKCIEKRETIIYPEKTGIIARYTGHVPGNKYKFGHTFWESTLNAKQRFEPKKMIWTSQYRATPVNP